MTQRESDAIALVREFSEDVNEGNFDALAEYFPDDYGDRYDGNVSVDGIISDERERAQAFEDKHEELDEILLAQNDDDGVDIEAWYTVSGTFVEEILSIPPTGNDVRFPLYRINRVEDDLITRHRVGNTIGFILHLGLNWGQLTEEVDLEQFMTTPEEAHKQTHGGEPPV